MKIVLTGSLGNIGKPLTKNLVKQNHEVTVISSNPKREKEIESLGAKAAIGDLNDVAFLISTFVKADAVYLMEAWDSYFFDSFIDFHASVCNIGQRYRKALEASGVKKVVHLSSVGAHTNKGNGMLQVHYEVEAILNSLPKDVSMKIIRPVGFYNNLYRFIPSIKNEGKIVSNYGGDKKEPWVSPLDIADAIADAFEQPFGGRTIHYVASDEISPNEIAKTLGSSIGKTKLKWQVVSDGQLLEGMLQIKMNPQIAKGMVEMQAAMGSGLLYEDFYQNKPALGKVKFTDFAQEFAAIYKRSKN